MIMETLAIGMSMMLLIYLVFLYIIDKYLIYENTIKKKKMYFLQKLSSFWSDVFKRISSNQNKRQFNV